MDIIQYTFFQNALIGILLISLAGAIVGTYIVTRRMVFIAGGITHASFGGLGIGFYYGINPTITAMIFALVSAFGVERLSQGKRVREDSAIAVFWALGMAIGIIFIFLTPGYTPGLTEFLFGNILTITRTDILVYTIFTLILILFFILFYRPILYTTFDCDFAHTSGIRVGFINACMTTFIAICVVLSIRLVGIMLLISILTMPQMVSELFCTRYLNIVFASAAICIVCGIAGLIISTLINVPTGASIVFTLVIVYLLAKLIHHLTIRQQEKQSSIKQ